MPVNSAMSMGIHESQSLLWERMVGLSKPFQVGLFFCFFSWVLMGFKFGAYCV